MTICNLGSPSKNKASHNHLNIGLWRQNDHPTILTTYQPSVQHLTNKLYSYAYLGFNTKSTFAEHHLQKTTDHSPQKNTSFKDL